MLPSRRRCALTFAMSALVALSACSDSPARGQSAGPPSQLAQRLLADSHHHWRTIEISGTRVHLKGNSAADKDSRAIVDAVETVRHELLARLDTPVSTTLPTADLFFVTSRDDVRQISGRPLTGFVQSDEPTAVIGYMPGYNYVNLMRHELTHLYAFQLWGAPRQGSWFVEGVAAWAARTCQGHSNDALAAAALVRGDLVSVNRLARAFREVREEVAMPQAGSIVAFLVDRAGLRALKDRWQRDPGDGAHPLDPDGAALEAAWLERVRRAAPATLDVPRLIREGC
jgi:hypothetical protein